MAAINPFLERIQNEHEKSEFMADYIQTFVDMNLTDKCTDDPLDLCFTIPYKLVLIHGRK